MLALGHWQEAIAQNLASVSVPGFRANETSFNGVLSEVFRLKDRSQRVDKEVKGVMPESEAKLSIMPGTNTFTGIPTNFAIDGEGFFRIRKPDGTVGYTRNGNFRMNDQRELVTQQGFTVDGESGPIKFRQEGGVIAISAEGKIVQGDQQLAKLPVYRFEKARDMRRLGDGLLLPAAGDAPRELEKSPLVHMVVESSNVAPLKEMVSMVNVNRAYEISQKVVQTHDELANRTIQDLGAPVS